MSERLITDRRGSGNFPIGSIESRAVARALLASVERCEQAIHDPWFWMSRCTRTFDNHWHENGADTPYRPFPDKPYFRPILRELQADEVNFIEKSRDLLLSWLCVGYLTHCAMVTPQREVLMQSMNEDKAAELIAYAKCLYSQQDSELQRRFPLSKPMLQQPAAELCFTNGSRIVSLPGGKDKIRSYHPWALLLDEAAFHAEAGESYNNAIAACHIIIVLSSAGPGWFSDFCSSASRARETQIAKGVAVRRSDTGVKIIRVHYSADPQRNGEWVTREKAKYTSESRWQREQEINHLAGGGQPLFLEILNRYFEKIVITDPAWRPSPHWRTFGGFDHGKTNPTAALKTCVDHDGVIHCVGEYYYAPNKELPVRSAHEHSNALLELPGFHQIREVFADPNMFYKTQQQGDGSFRSLADLYIEAGLDNLCPAPNNVEVVGMERILEHWRDLDHREPTLKIYCPRPLDHEERSYGVHAWGCPNLLWELYRARREELSAQQLLARTPSEKIVDQHNHLRDALKYVILALPGPTAIPLQQKLEDLHSRIEQGEMSLTNAMIRRRKLEEQARKDNAPTFIGSRARLRQSLFQRRTRSSRRDRVQEWTE